MTWIKAAGARPEYDAGMSSSSLVSRPPISPAQTLGALVTARPALARIFERLRLDYCCGGRQALAEACTRRGLDVRSVIATLEAVEAGQGAPEVDAAAMSLTQLADHIVATHHAFVKEELPRLVELADRVAAKHGERDPRVREVAGLVRDLTEEMFSHMHKEEMVLFPAVRRIEAGERSNLSAAALAAPIRQMEAEHQAAGDCLARLRVLTEGFRAAPEDCNSHRALLAGLAEFESDLHRHVHKENNILFPRALAAAG